MFAVAARGDVDDAYVELLLVLKNPLEAALYVLLADVAGLADLDEHDVAVGRDGSEEAARERAVPGRDDRSHHAVPARNVYRVERARPLRDDVVVGKYAALGRRQIGVRVEAGIQKGYG